MALFVPNFLIALREGVEAALVVGILVAYINRVGRTDILPKLWIGVVLAAAVPLGLGVYWTWGPVTLTFQAQEILGGTFSLIAGVFVTWMIFWMGKNSRKMTQNIKKQAEEALESGNVMGLVWLAVVSVAREGAETAIFVFGVVKSANTTGVVEPALGVLVGLIAAIIVGYLVYKGSVLIDLHLFFNVTGYLLIFVAAGIMLYGVHDLQEASVLPGWGTYLYDFNWVITPVLSQWWFVILNAFFNLQYLFAPSAMQFAIWAIYLIIVFPLFTLQIKGKIFTDKSGKEKPAVAAPEESEKTPETV